MCAIRFYGDDTEHIVLVIHGRNIPAAQDYWDGNFLWCTVAVAAGAFRGSAGGVIRNEDLIRFSTRLEDLYLRLDGQALFDTLDGWMDLRVICSDSGRAEVRGEVCTDAIGGGSLEFRLVLDQTSLSSLIAQVQMAIEAFPIVGTPPS